MENNEIKSKVTPLNTKSLKSRGSDVTLRNSNLPQQIIALQQAEATHEFSFNTEAVETKESNKSENSYNESVTDKRFTQRDMSKKGSTVESDETDSDTDRDSNQSDSSSDGETYFFPFKLVYEHLFSRMAETGRYLPEDDESSDDEEISNTEAAAVYGDVTRFENGINSTTDEKGRNNILFAGLAMGVFAPDIILLRAVEQYFAHVQFLEEDDDDDLLHFISTFLVINDNIHILDFVLKHPSIANSLYTLSEKDAASLLHKAITNDCCKEILAALDNLWANTYSSPKSSPDVHLDRILEFYKRYSRIPSELSQTEETIMCALKFGIHRHVQTLLIITDIHLFLKSNPSAIVFIAKLPVKICVERVTEREIHSLQNWYGDLNFTSTTFNTDQKTNVPKSSAVRVIKHILDLIDTKSDERNIVLKSVMGFLVRITRKRINFLGKCWKCTPILVGSESENTRSFFPNEFDVLLLFSFSTIHGDNRYPDYTKLFADFNSWVSDNERESFYLELFKYLRKAIKHEQQQQQQQQDSCLVIEEAINLLEYSSFPCLVVWWRGKTYKYMKIKIDLVPAFPHSDEFAFPKHNYYSEERRCRITIKRSTTVQNISFSETENGIMRNLPSNIRNGYILAKAIRNMHLLAPIVQRLFDLGVIQSIDDVVRSYMLKTCVLFLTQNLGQQDKRIQYGRFYWAIRIYEQLRDFVWNGKIPHFFLNSINGKGEEQLFLCLQWHHSLDTLQYRCCRKRAAMLAIIDRLLDVLTSHCPPVNVYNRDMAVQFSSTRDFVTGKTVVFKVYDAHEARIQVFKNLLKKI